MGFDGEILGSRSRPGDKSKVARPSRSAGRLHTRTGPTTNFSGERPSTAASKHTRDSGCFKVEPAALPRLECRGRQLSPSRSKSPDAHAAVLVSRAHNASADSTSQAQSSALRPRSRSPKATAFMSSLHASEPLLVTGAAGSNNRPMSSTAPARASNPQGPPRALRRSTGGSMPQLVKQQQQQPPRLLVQSVGSAY